MSAVLLLALAFAVIIFVGITATYIHDLLHDHIFARRNTPR